MELMVSLALWFAAARADPPMALVYAQVTAHAGQSGAYVLERAEEALIARAWLADHAQTSIDVQYFIWSTDNVGVLAAESLLRAAERGVRVRILVDDLLIDAPARSLLALAHHPNIDIRIYNPKKSVGVPFHAKFVNLARDFRGFNQRMHDKMVVIDGIVAITGGRNMANEYYDYDHRFNFRDRDALVLGDVVRSMHDSFERFWTSPLSVEVEKLYDGYGLMQQNVTVDDAEIQKVYEELHDHASSPVNFAPEVREAIRNTPRVFPRMARDTVWTRIEFVSDLPGKNARRFGLAGGSLSASALRTMVDSAREEIVIQTPYLVMSDGARTLFRNTVDRGVAVSISTNSLASTDNVAVFSGYRSQRRGLLRMGLRIFEYKPDAAVDNPRIATLGKRPITGMHAKTMVVDSRVVYIGTYNLDPRSENLNTESGVIIHDERVAKAVEREIEEDMEPHNSWNAATDDSDQYVSFRKRMKACLLQLLPLRPIL